MTAVDTTFDPADATPEFVANVATKQQCAQVIEHLGLPALPKSWKLDDFRRVALGAMAAVSNAEADRLVEGERAAKDAADAAYEEERDEAARLRGSTEREATGQQASTDLGEHVAEPGTALEPARPSSAVVIPDAAKWQQIIAIGQTFAKSKLVPSALQGKPEDCVIVALAANDLGIPLTQAFDKIHVINGRKGMAAELMIALALRDGHVVTPDPGNDNTQATVHITRRDTGASASVTFTLQDALDAKLCGLDEDGRVVAKKDGKALPWELYTADMLWARAVARGMRRMCPDCLAGVSYTPDELGYIESDDDARPAQGRHGDATVTVNEQRQSISQRAAELNDEGRAALAAEWKAKNYPRTPKTATSPGGKADFSRLTPAAMRQVQRFLDGLDAGHWHDQSAPADAAPGDEGSGPEQVGGSQESPGDPVPGTGDPVEGGTEALSGDDEPGEAEIVCSFEGCTADPDPESVLGLCAEHKEF